MDGAIVHYRVRFTTSPPATANGFGLAVGPIPEVATTKRSPVHSIDRACVGTGNPRAQYLSACGCRLRGRLITPQPGDHCTLLGTLPASGARHSGLLVWFALLKLVMRRISRGARFEPCSEGVHWVRVRTNRISLYPRVEPALVREAINMLAEGYDGAENVDATLGPDPA